MKNEVNIHLKEKCKEIIFFPQIDQGKWSE